MNTDLEPPAVPPLSPDQRDRLRRQLMHKTRPAVRRTPAWAAPLVAVGAVAAIVAGTIAVADRPQAEPDPAASPAPTTWTRHTAGPIPPHSVTILPFPADADLGEASPDEAGPAARACRVTRYSNPPNSVLWWRGTKGISPDTKLITMIVKVAGQSGAYSEGIALCQTGLDGIAVRDSQWAQQPDAQHGLVALGSGRWDAGETTMYKQQWTVYRARPDIARIESRYTWKTGSGPWIRGVVAKGFAYTDVRAIPVGDAAGLTQQIRAYDAQGRPVPV